METRHRPRLILQETPSFWYRVLLITLEKRPGGNREIAAFMLFFFFFVCPEVSDIWPNVCLSMNHLRSVVFCLIHPEKLEFYLQLPLQSLLPLLSFFILFYLFIYSNTPHTHTHCSTFMSGLDDVTLMQTNFLDFLQLSSPFQSPTVLTVVNLPWRD